MHKKCNLIKNLFMSFIFFICTFIALSLHSEDLSTTSLANVIADYELVVFDIDDTAVNTETPLAFTKSDISDEQLMYIVNQLDLTQHPNILNEILTNSEWTTLITPSELTKMRIANDGSYEFFIENHNFSSAAETNFISVLVFRDPVNEQNSMIFLEQINKLMLNKPLGAWEGFAFSSFFELLRLNTIQNQNQTIGLHTARGHSPNSIRLAFHHLIEDYSTRYKLPNSATLLSQEEITSIKEQLTTPNIIPSTNPEIEIHPTHGHLMHTGAEAKAVNLIRYIKEINKKGQPITKVTIFEDSETNLKKLIKILKEDPYAQEGLNGITFNYILVTPDKLKNELHKIEVDLSPKPNSSKNIVTTTTFDLNRNFYARLPIELVKLNKNAINKLLSKVDQQSSCSKSIN